MRDIEFEGKTYAAGDDGYGNLVIGKPQTDAEFEHDLPPHRKHGVFHLTTVSIDGTGDGVGRDRFFSSVTDVYRAVLILAGLGVITCLILWPVITLVAILIIAVVTGLSVAAL